MSIIYEGPLSISLAGRASVIEDARELAWAEKHVRVDRDIKWILGNFVQADMANDNGHIFPLQDLKAAQQSIVHKPLNMVHEPHRIVGHYAAVEMLFPTGEGAAALETAHIEALSAFYRYYFKDEYEKIQAAHSEGALFYSMECIPERLVCAADDCGQEFAYEGRTHESYCAHLQELAAPRRLIRPHFTGGALIIPPIRPGWKRADIKELSRLFEQHETTYEAVKDMAPHLSPTQWETLMLAIMEEARDVPSAERKKLANKGAALPDGSFPIANIQDLKNAIKAVGRAKDPARAKAHIKRAAKRLGAEDLLPADWV